MYLNENLIFAAEKQLILNCFKRQMHKQSVEKRIKEIINPPKPIN